jgi:hypothetical protein
LDECIPSRIEEATKEADGEVPHSVYFLPFCSAYSWILKMEAIYSSETMMNFYQAT